jgi:hypothetical protein
VYFLRDLGVSIYIGLTGWHEYMGKDRGNGVYSVEIPGVLYS